MRMTSSRVTCQVLLPPTSDEEKYFGTRLWMLERILLRAVRKWRRVLKRKGPTEVWDFQTKFLKTKGRKRGRGLTLRPREKGIRKAEKVTDLILFGRSFLLLYYVHKWLILRRTFHGRIIMCLYKRCLGMMARELASHCVNLRKWKDAE